MGYQVFGMFCARRAPSAGATHCSEATASPTTSARSPLPPVSSTGKRYYCFTTRSQCQGRPPFIVVGHLNAIAWLGGSFTNRGTAPKGFSDIEGAVEYLEETSGVKSCRIEWSTPLSNDIN